MRILCFFFIIALFYSCNDDITAIGHNLVNDAGFVEIIEHKIYNTSTIKIDSFPTSAERDAEMKFAIGKVNDPISGTTKATPYIVFERDVLSEAIQRHFIYDSITLHINFADTVRGDTTQLQTFHVHQLKQVPVAGEEDLLLYNNQTTPYEPNALLSFQFLPYRERYASRELRYRVSDSIGYTLYEMLRTRNDNIMEELSFLKFFKGMAFVPDESNTCMMVLDANAASLYFKIHYHDAGKNYSYNIRSSSSTDPPYKRFTFVNIENDATGTPYAALTSQFDNLNFRDAQRPNAPNGQVFSQGLGGYMIKMQIPLHPAYETYKTIVKAEIEFHMQYRSSLGNFKELYDFYIYKSDVYNKIGGVIAPDGKTPLIGRISYNLNNPEEDKYVLNITDYYNSLCQTANILDNNYVVVGINTEHLKTSFDRMVIDEIPVLRVYYAIYE